MDKNTAIAEIDDMEAQRAAIYKDMLEWPRGNAYSLDTKIDVITTYFIDGSVKGTSRKTGVPENTIDYWKRNAPWWDSQLGVLRAEKSAEYTARSYKIIEKSQAELLDRIENGDEQILKDGSAVRKRMSGKDLATVAGITYDKLRIEHNLPNKITGNTDQLAQVMNKLLNFRENIEKQAINGESVRIDDKPEND